MSREGKAGLFIDSSAWIALFDAGDANHERAKVFFTPENLQGLGLVPLTSNFIFAEVYAYFCRAPLAAVTVGEAMRSSKVLRYIRVTPADEEAAWELAQKYRDKDFSFVDCLSFALMERLGCQKAFAFGRHFRQMGYEVFPGED